MREERRCCWVLSTHRGQESETRSQRGITLEVWGEMPEKRSSFGRKSPWTALRDPAFALHPAASSPAPRQTLADSQPARTLEKWWSRLGMGKDHSLRSPEHRRGQSHVRITHLLHKGREQRRRVHLLLGCLLAPRSTRNGRADAPHTSIP